MQSEPIHFSDGAAYEDFMGRWSQLVGDSFLRWLDPSPGWRWVDVGCGNGAFTQMLVERCAPAAVQGIDSSKEQIAYARERAGRGSARFDIGDAMALPYADASFDAAVMALVIFFVRDPALSVAEMARVVRPGGSVSAYSWTSSAAPSRTQRCRRKWQSSRRLRPGRRASRRPAWRRSGRSGRARG